MGLFIYLFEFFKRFIPETIDSPVDYLLLLLAFVCVGAATIFAILFVLGFIAGMYGLVRFLLTMTFPKLDTTRMKKFNYEVYPDPNNLQLEPIPIYISATNADEADVEAEKVVRQLLADEEIKEYNLSMIDLPKPRKVLPINFTGRLLRIRMKKKRNKIFSRWATTYMNTYKSE